jgi:hypothetical protein
MIATSHFNQKPTMKTTLILVLMFTAGICQAQTKVISHKSHSGSKSQFSGAYQKNLFDLKRSNFGGPRLINVVVLDSVVAVNDSVTVLKMRQSNSCYDFHIDYKALKDSDFIKKTETVVNHPILNRKKTVAFIHSSRGQLFWFDNPIESVVFVGFKK